MSLANLPTVQPQVLQTSITGNVSALQLAASSSGVSLAVRQGTAIRVYANITDTLPAFDAVMPGDFNIVRASEGIVLAVCDVTGGGPLRTFIFP